MNEMFTPPVMTFPHSIEAEQALLGAFVMNQDAFDVVERKYKLVATDFYEPIHQELFSAFRSAHESGQRLDFRLAVAALGTLAETQIAESMTAAKYVAQLAAEATTIVNAPDYARTIRELADRRRLLDVAETLAMSARSDLIPTEIASTAIEALDACATGYAEQAAVRVDLSRAAERSVERMTFAMQNPGKLTGLSFGVSDLDHKTGGLHAGDLIVLAGRPGMGKSGVAVSVAKTTAQNGIPAVYYSLEMGDVSLADRVLSDLCFDDRDRITYESIARGSLNDNQASRIIEAQRALWASPLMIEVQGGLSLAQIATRARKHQKGLERQGKQLGLVIVDHMHIVAASKRYSGHRVNEVSEISAGLKALAKELNIPVLALAQLSRSVESRDNKRPTMSDLRDSGAIEQDADLILFLYREAYYLKDKLDDHDKDQQRLARLMEVENRLEVAIGKNRNGPTHTIELFFDAGCNALRSMSRWGK